MDNRKFQAAAIATPPAAEDSPSTGYPTDGDPAGGVPATVPGAAWFHQVGEELRAILTAASITPDHTVLTQLLTALRSAGVFQTAAQFDNTTKVATMQAVNRALGSLSGFTNINANVTLTAAYAGRGCYFSAAAIATLPLANTVAPGTLLHFTSFTAGATSVARQGTDTIAAAAGSSALTSMVLSNGEDLILESNDAGTQWIVVGGSARLRYADSFKSFIGSVGYKAIPDKNSPSGLFIFQWGSGTITAGTAATLTFPTAFTTSQPRVTPIAVGSGGTAAQFMQLISTSETQASFNINSGGPWNFSYTAIGY